MTAPAQACGTCKWWTPIHSCKDHEPAPNCVGECTYPLPFSVEQIQPYYQSGETCKTWNPK